MHTTWCKFLRMDVSHIEGESGYNTPNRFQGITMCKRIGSRSLVSAFCLSKFALQWRHNGRNDVSNNRLIDCLLSRLFTHQRKHQIADPGHYEGNSPVNSPHKGPVTRKMFPFDDVFMVNCWIGLDKGVHLTLVITEVAKSFYLNVRWDTK